MTATEDRIIAGKTLMMRLECDLTDAEIVDYCRQTATLITVYEAKEQEKKDVVALYTKELKKTRSTMDRLAKAATTGKEDRDVRCQERFVLDRGEVEYFRCDTGQIEEGRTRAMTADEKARFGQQNFADMEDEDDEE